MKTFIKKKFPSLYNLLILFKNYIIGFSRRSYSQFGEDLVLSTFLNTNEIKKGFYVDIGAYKPKEFSNTYFYYRRNWKGINIDAKPGSMNFFKKSRKRDINLELGVSKEAKDLEFYIFKGSVYNTFSKELADLYISQGILFEKKVIIKTTRLDDIMEKYLPINQKIDFMSVDVEGFDLEVLESNNWDKYKPSYILAEMQDVNISDIKESDIYKFLINKGYKLVSVVYITLIFKL